MRPKETFQALCARLNVPLQDGMEIGKYAKDNFKSSLPTVEEMWNIVAERLGCKPDKKDCTYERCFFWGGCSRTIEALHARINQPSPRKSGDSGGESGQVTTTNKEALKAS